MSANIGKMELDFIAGSGIPEIVNQMWDMHLKYRCEVTARLNGCVITFQDAMLHDLLKKGKS